VIYNSYIAPNNVTTDSHFLRYDFTEKMLDALGIKDSTGVIYELINYRYFTEDVLGTWDLMIDGMVNVRLKSSCLCPTPLNLLLACWDILHQSLYVRVYEVQLSGGSCQLFLLI